MNSDMPVQPGHSRKQDFPLRLLAAAFVISLLTTVFGGWQMWQMHHRVEAWSDKRAALVEDVGRIMQYDEVLTMSARMAAATGDFAYEKRYDEFDPILTMEIDEVRALLPQAEIAAFVRETDDANNALVKMERQAFALAHQGRRQEATALLASTEYLRLKKVYAGGMEKTVNAATSLIEREDRHLEAMSLWFAAASAVGVLVLLATWFLAVRSARSWAAERREAEEALREASDGLEVQVEQRTADLSGANEQLRHEISERKQVAQALEASELKFRTILDSAVDGILVADGQSHKFVTANSSICAMLGYPLEAMYTLGMEDIHPAEKLAEVQEGFERQLKGEIRMAINLPVKRKDGSIFFADVSASPMVLEGHTFLVGIFHDVTEREVMEREIRMLNEGLEAKVQERTQQLLVAQEELVRKEKLAVLGQVAGSVGHELRNPLGVMSNAVYFLQTVLADSDETTREYLNIIKNEITSSERIVSDLLDSVRTKLPQPEAIGVAELIEQALRKCSVPSSVSVQMDIPASLPPLRVDAQQIHQVLRNLISNAIEAMPQGGTLEIRAVEVEAKKSIAVSVRDTGVGMSAEQLDRMFQPLFTTKARGIGLGLVVVKNLTQANGGRVEVQSESGKGTLFTVTLPADAGEVP